MKKFLLPILLLVTSLGMTVHAQTNMVNYIIDEAEFSIDLPDDCFVVRQNISENDPYLEKTGAKKEDVEKYFYESGIMLDVVQHDNKYEIVFTVNESDSVNYVYNLQSLSDSQIQEFATNIENTYKEYGYSVYGHQIYTVDGKDATYLYFRFGQRYDNKSVNCRQYYTIRDNKIYSITLRDFNGYVTQAMENTMRDIIDSIEYFDVMGTKPYHDNDVGVKFHISDGWKEAQSTIENKSISGIQYVHRNNLGETIQFTYFDLWGNLSPIHRFFNTREDIGLKNGEISKIAKSYMRGFFGNTEKDDTKMVSYNGYVYLTSDIPIKVSVEDGTEEYYLKNVVTARNGIVYAFQYGYYKDNALHEKDFYELLDTITFDEPRLLSTDEEYYVEMTRTLFFILNIVVLLFITLLAVIFLYIKSKVNSENA